MYILLTGKPPFAGNDEFEIIKNVKTGIYDLTIPEMMVISSEAKSLIS